MVKKPPKGFSRSCRIMFIMSNYAPEFGATTPLFSTFSAFLFSYFVRVIFDTLGMGRMRKEFKIYCTSADIGPDRLIRLFHFGKSEDALAAELGVTVSTVQAWKAGKAPVPVVCVKYLELLDNKELRCDGVWNGARAEGSRLIVPAGYQVTIDYAEIERLADYRRLFHLRTMQTDLIERLMIERDFYRENCHRQARFGLMVNSLFG